MKDDDQKRAPGAPRGNQHAAKDEGDGLDAVLHLRVKGSEKNAWVKKAQKEGKKLAEWARDRLNA